jgi:hypothetical protein
MPVYPSALKDSSGVVAFSDELDFWISRASPAREDVVPNNESLLQVLKVRSLVGDIPGLASQIHLWSEPPQQPIKFHLSRRIRDAYQHGCGGEPRLGHRAVLPALETHVAF